MVQGAANFCSLLQRLPWLDYRCWCGHNCPVLTAFILWTCLGLPNHFFCLSNFLNQELLHSSRTLCCLFFKEILPVPRVSGISDCPGIGSFSSTFNSTFSLHMFSNPGEDAQHNRSSHTLTHCNSLSVLLNYPNP